MFFLCSLTSNQKNFQKKKQRGFLKKKNLRMIVEKISPNQKKLKKTKKIIFFKSSDTFFSFLVFVKVVIGCTITGFSIYDFSAFFFFLFLDPFCSTLKNFTKTLTKKRERLRLFVRKIYFFQDFEIFSRLLTFIRSVLIASFLKNTSLVTFYKKLIILKFFV